MAWRQGPTKLLVISQEWAQCRLCSLPNVASWSLFHLGASVQNYCPPIALLEISIYVVMYITAKTTPAGPAMAAAI